MKDRNSQGALLFALSILSIVLVSECVDVDHAPAQDAPALTELEQQVALNHLRLTANEAGFHRPVDSLAIWQTLVNVRGARPAEMLEAQNAHSGRVTGARPPRNIGNEVWTRHLAWSCEEPTGWPSVWRWERHRTGCEHVRELATRLVQGRHPYHVCEGRPITWGGQRGLDSAAMERRNAARAEHGAPPLVPLRCIHRGREPINVFFGLRGDTGDDPVVDPS